jgi:hypothetical protein
VAVEAVEVGQAEAVVDMVVGAEARAAVVADEAEAVVVAVATGAEIAATAVIAGSLSFTSRDGFLL